MSEFHEKTLTIQNIRGLHARASAKFVKCAEKFDASLEVSKDNTTVGGTSLMGLMMLGASMGSHIKVVAKGKEAREALDAIEALIGQKFDEIE